MRMMMIKKVMMCVVHIMERCSKSMNLYKFVKSSSLNRGRIYSTVPINSIDMDSEFMLKHVYGNVQNLCTWWEGIIHLFLYMTHKKCMAYNGKNILWPTGHKKVCHNIVVWFRHFGNQYYLFVWTKFIHNKWKIFQVRCQRIWNPNSKS